MKPNLGCYGFALYGLLSIFPGGKVVADAGANGKPGAAVVRDAGGSFRVSFLDSEPVLEETSQLLVRHGFPSDTVATFQRLVRHHNKNGNRVERARFPADEAGWYEFRDLNDLTSRLVVPFSQTPGTNTADECTLTCFDFVCLLLHDVGVQVPSLSQDFQSKGFILATTVGIFRSVSYQEWLGGSGSLLYPTNCYEYLVGRVRSDEEGLLDLSLRAALQLHSTNSVQALARDAVAQHGSALERSGLEFPRKFMLGLAFLVRPDRDWTFSDHAFLCFPSGHRLICLEKVGSRGPYVRAEFQSEEDLGRFISWDELQAASSPDCHESGSSVAVSLNERLIGSWPH